MLLVSYIQQYSIFNTSFNSQFWQIRFESYWLHCSKFRILVLLPVYGTYISKVTASASNAVHVVDQAQRVLRTARQLVLDWPRDGLPWAPDNYSSPSVQRGWVRVVSKWSVYPKIAQKISYKMESKTIWGGMFVPYFYAFCLWGEYRQWPK